MQFQSNSYLFLCGNWQADSNIYLERQKARKVKTEMQKKSKAGRCRHLAMKTFYKATLLDTVWS